MVALALAATAAAAPAWAEEAPTAPAETPPAAPAPAAAPATPSPQTPPEEPTGPARAALERGWREFRYSNYELALVAFDKAAATADPEVQAEALYAEALLWQTRQPEGDLARAKALYGRVADAFTATRAAPFAVMALARFADLPEYEENRDLDVARRLYQQILDTWPDHVMADEAALRLAMTYLEAVGDEASEARGIRILRDHAARRPENILAAAIFYQLGNAHYRQADYGAAVEAWTRAFAAGIAGMADQANLCYRIGSVIETRLAPKAAEPAPLYLKAADWYDRVWKDIALTNKYYIAKQSAARCRTLAAEAAAGEAP